MMGDHDQDLQTFMRQRASAYRKNTGGPVEGWSDDAQKAITENPKYFVWWYTAKSLALVGAIGAAIFFYCKWQQAKKK
jgi:hypothetical protein